jgi:coatomer protein complex subunit alpha (xenin)
MLPAIPSAPVGATEVPLRAVQGTASDTTPGRAQNSLAALPLAQFSLNALIETKLKAAYRATTGGQFDNAMELFRSIIASVPLVTAQNPKEVSEARELLRICSQYLVGLRMEQTRKADAASLGIKRVTEMASYFAHVELTPGHQQLALRSAMNVAFKAKCFGVAGQFARRLLDTDPKQDIQAQARKLVRFCDEQQKGANAIDLDYDPRHPFEICAGSFRALYRGKDESVTCPLCESTYSTEFAGQLCASCEISEVGLESSGLMLHASQNESSGRRR